MSKPSHSRDFRGTREAGLERLVRFVPSAGRAYSNRRNADFGPDDRANVSVLSPYIRHRLITEREVLEAVLARHSLDAAEKFVQEVFWRSYFKGHLETRPGIWSSYREVLQTQQAAVQNSGGFARAYRRAVEAKTGIDCFDAWVEELQETGYLHNHTRMWFASIWIFTLKLPWELGADFTYRHFVDGDPASNTLSWRWVGGLHTRGKPYLARPDNIAEHTAQRFRPKGLAREAPSLEEPVAASIKPLPSAATESPKGPALLLLTEEDLHVESLPMQGADIRGVIGSNATTDRSDFAVSEHAVRFAKEALTDGMARATAKFGVEGEIVERLKADALIRQCRALGVERIITAYLPVGPMAAQVSSLRSTLEKAGILLVEIRREEDSLIWPHTTKGFFGLRERIPDLLDRLGICGKPSTGDSQPDLFVTQHRAAAHR